MKRLGSTARSPLFLRIFVLMLICVAVVQSMNVALLIVGFFLVVVEMYIPGFGVPGISGLI